MPGLPRNARFLGQSVASAFKPRQLLRIIFRKALDMGGRLCYIPGRLRRFAARHFDGRIAQLVEQLTLNQRVLGSSPSAPTIETQIKSDSWRTCCADFPAFRKFCGSMQGCWARKGGIVTRCRPPSPPLEIKNYDPKVLLSGCLSIKVQDQAASLTASDFLASNSSLSAKKVFGPNWARPIWQRAAILAFLVFRTSQSSR